MPRVSVEMPSHWVTRRHPCGLLPVPSIPSMGHTSQGLQSSPEGLPNTPPPDEERDDQRRRLPAPRSPAAKRKSCVWFRTGVPLPFSNKLSPRPPPHLPEGAPCELVPLGLLTPWCLGLSSAPLVPITPRPPALMGSLSRWPLACQPHLHPRDPPGAKGHQTHGAPREGLPGKTGAGAKQWLCALLPPRWLWAGHCPGSQKERRCCPWLLPGAQVLAPARGRGAGGRAAGGRARSCEEEEEVSVVSSSGSGNNSPLSFLAEPAESVSLQGCS